jgi:hypothetical protein
LVSAAAALRKQNFEPPVASRFMMALLTYLRGTMGPCWSKRSWTEALKRRAEFELP